ncbi:MAG: hypothetical protein GF403_07775 [Candidatus Coatesbacteria bacterium]|nr:hypothetical protein [Candidatus Coatesbacteria bacterium]
MSGDSSSQQRHVHQASTHSEPMSDHHQQRHHHSKAWGFWPRLLRFLGFWLGISGLYASTTVCPCCGQAGCPVGLAAAGVLGGGLAFILTYARGFWRRLKSRFKRSKQPARSSRQ